MERESFTLEVGIVAPFLFWKRKKIIKIECLQANLKELFDFIDQIESGKEIANRTVEFVAKHSKRLLSDNEKAAIYIQNGTIFNVLYDTYFKDCFKKQVKNKQKAAKSIDAGPIQANIAFIAKETSTSILDLYEMCTIQDIEYLMEGIIWNLNAQSKEGQKRNQLRLIQKKAERRTPEEEEAIKAKLDKIPD